MIKETIDGNKLKQNKNLSKMSNQNLKIDIVKEKYVYNFKFKKMSMSGPNRLAIAVERSKDLED